VEGMIRCSITTAYISNIFEWVAFAKSNNLHFAEISYMKRSLCGAKFCWGVREVDVLLLTGFGGIDTNSALIAFGKFGTY
jgi:hypothetical protein